MFAHHHAHTHKHTLGITRDGERAQEAAINAMDYDATGTLLVTSSDDETLRLYSTETATSRKVLFSKKYGIDLVRFTHSQEAVICASKNNWDGLLR